MNTTLLDTLIKKHKAQPVARGYADIIVSRDTYKDFVSALVTHNFNIKHISWWEWCAEKKNSVYGLGGPKSIFYNGWFLEVPVEDDHIYFAMGISHDQAIAAVVNTIESKAITLSDKTVTFSTSTWLTPGIGLDVSEE